MRRSVSVVAVLVAASSAAASIGACDRGGGDGGAGPRPTVATSTTSTTVIDVSVVPEEVTVAYLDAVVDRLDALVGEAFRELVRERAPNRRFLDLLDAVYDGQEFEDKQSVYGEIAADDFENVRPDPGDPVTTVERIIKNEPDCVIVAADRTFAAFFVEPHEGGQAYLAFARTKDDARKLNPTAWSLVFDGGTLDDVEPTSAC